MQEVEYLNEENDNPDAHPRSVGVKSVERVIQLYEYFRARPKPARNIEIARALKIPSSSTSELLKTLLAHGYISFNEQNRKYGPAFRMVSLGRDFANSCFGGQRLFDLMHSVFELAQETVTLTVECGDRVQLADQVLGPFVNLSLHGTGTPLTIVQSATGRALLSTRKKSSVLEAARYVARTASPPEKHAIVTQILKDIDRTRERGYSLAAPGYHPPFVSSIAIPLPVKYMELQMMIGVYGPSILGNETDCAEMLKQRINRVLS